MTGHFKYVYPPRPRGKIDPRHLTAYERQKKWVVQRKFNGCRNLIHVTSEGYILLYGREGDPHENFVPPNYLIDEIRTLNFNPGFEYWLDGELLDNKTSTAFYKNKIVLFDILQFKGNYLFMSPSLTERTKILHNLCGNPINLEPGGLALQVSPHLLLAESWTSNFMDRYLDHIDKPEIEGLVLKLKNSTLDNLGKAYYEVDWQIRCRKPNKNYNR